MDNFFYLPTKLISNLNDRHVNTDGITTNPFELTTALFQSVGVLQENDIPDPFILKGNIKTNN